MKFYLFRGGMLKLEDDIPVRDILVNVELTRVTRLQYYAHRMRDTSKKTAAGLKRAGIATKVKASAVKDAIVK
jgi:hypothetical protein